LPLEYTRLALNDVLQFAERWEKSFPPPIGTLKDIVRQSNMVERERREKLEPPATEQERSVALENIARIKKILEEAGEKMSVTKERALPTRKREKSEPIYWDQNQCGNPDCEFARAVLRGCAQHYILRRLPRHPAAPAEGGFGACTMYIRVLFWW
jgi:hypothetical protein